MKTRPHPLPNRWKIKQLELFIVHDGQDPRQVLSMRPPNPLGTRVSAGGAKITKWVARGEGGGRSVREKGLRSFWAWAQPASSSEPFCGRAVPVVAEAGGDGGPCRNEPERGQSLDTYPSLPFPGSPWLPLGLRGSSPPVRQSNAGTKSSQTLRIRSQAVSQSTGSRLPGFCSSR